MKGIFIIYPSGEIECMATYYTDEELRLKKIQEELIESLEFCPTRKYEKNVRYIFEESLNRNSFSCNLYKYYYKKEPGWIYNSYTEQKDHLLEIRIIQLKENNRVNQECQTEFQSESKRQNENKMESNKETIKVFKMLLDENKDMIHIIKKKIE